MFTLFLIGLSLLSVTVLASICIWPHIKMSWLYTIGGLLAVSLPFERIPSIDIGVSLRVNLILVALGVWLSVVYMLKHMPKLHLDRVSYWLIAFVLVSLPSTIQIMNMSRFAVSWIAMAIVFIGCNIVLYLTPNPQKIMRILLRVMAGVTIFGYYQFVGDLIGIPPIFTGLSELYVKEIFGFPRIQSTAQEPLYFGGMLFLPIIMSLMAMWKGVNVWTGSAKNYSISTNLNTFIFFALALVLTISNSAIISLSLAIIAIIIVLSPHIKAGRLFGSIWSVVVIASFFVIAGLLLFPALRDSAYVAIGHTINSLTGRSPSNIERTLFLQEAFRLLNIHPLFGIGSGQYGVFTELRFPNQKDDQFLIVNNVYVEIWLEQGVAALIVFLSMWLDSLKRALQYFRRHTDMYSISLIGTLIAYLVQWLFFSPLYIMPIFIIFGLLISMVRSDNQKLEV